MMGAHEGKIDNKHNGQVVLCDATDGFREVKRVTLPELGWAQHVEFSPGQGEFLLLVSRELDRTIVVLDAETLEEPAWSRCFRTLLLPAGKILFHTVRWVTDPSGVEEPDGEEESAPPPLILQAAIGHQLHLINITAFIRSFEEDGNFSVQQLRPLSDIIPDAIPLLLERLPHAINLRDPETGDTVLHHCAREGSVLLAATKAWLDGADAPYELLPDVDGNTALRVAVEKHHADIASALLASLNPRLPLVKTELLTQDLVAVAGFLPGHLVEFIELLQDTQHFGLFRTQRTIHFLKRRLDEFVVRGSDDGLGTELWSEYVEKAEKDGAIRSDTKLEVLALRGFVGSPTSGDSLPPYSELLEAATTGEKQLSETQLNDLLNTKLMQVATAFSWQTCESSNSRPQPSHAVVLLTPTVAV